MTKAKIWRGEVRTHISLQWRLLETPPPKPINPSMIILLQLDPYIKLKFHLLE